MMMLLKINQILHLIFYLNVFNPDWLFIPGIRLKTRKAYHATRFLCKLNTYATELMN